MSRSASYKALAEHDTFTPRYMYAWAYNCPWHILSDYFQTIALRFDNPQHPRSRQSQSPCKADIWILGGSKMPPVREMIAFCAVDRLRANIDGRVMLPS